MRLSAYVSSISWEVLCEHKGWGKKVHPKGESSMVVSEGLNISTLSVLGSFDLFCFRGVSVLDGASLSLLRLGPSVSVAITQCSVDILLKFVVPCLSE